jgi:hypothetical protein
MIDIERLARKTGAIPVHEKPKQLAIVGQENIERFAGLVLEAAANAADELQAPPSCNQLEKSLWDVATTSVGDVIRALKDKK